MRNATRGHKPDHVLLIIAAALLAIGLVVVYSVSPGMSALAGVSEGYYISRQLVAITLGIIAFLVMSKFPYRNLNKILIPLIVLSVISTLAVRIVGEEINGAYRWIQIGGLSFQPAELVKFTILIWVADFFANKRAQGRLADTKSIFIALGIVAVLVVVLIGFMQSDLGSSAVIMAILGVVIFLSGMPLVNVLRIAIAVVILAVLMIAPSEYRRGRLSTFMNPAADCQNEGYQSCQALIAVGSGGLFGLGLAKSVQAYGYLPEATNDSIFAVLGEKFGFVGVASVLALFVALLMRLARISERAPDDFSKFLVIGILAWFSVQSIINIGAMLGVLPLKGITLPFVSYGGTSVLFVMGALGLAFQVSRYSSLMGKKRIENESLAYGRGQRRAYHASASRR